MSWNTLSLHFKQQYEGAFRYLDRCGEFMLAAVEELDLLPGETKPTGAKLERPESGLTVTVDTLELVATQELPGEDARAFPEICITLAGLVKTHFQPKGVIRNGFACKSYWPIVDVDALLSASLRYGGTAHLDLGKQLGLVPAHKRLDLSFSSGSMELHVMLHPVTFEKVSINRHQPGFNASSGQKRRAQRLNASADRFSRPLSHALVLETDLMEVDPPSNSLDQHFCEMKRYAETLRKYFDFK